MDAREAELANYWNLDGMPAQNPGEQPYCRFSVGITAQIPKADQPCRV